MTVMFPLEPLIDRDLADVKNFPAGVIVFDRDGSQLSTWIGLGPFVISKYLIGNPSFNLRPSTSKATQEFPSRLLYANRKKVQPLDYESFRKGISNW